MNNLLVMTKMRDIELSDNMMLFVAVICIVLAIWFNIFIRKHSLYFINNKKTDKVMRVTLTIIGIFYLSFDLFQDIFVYNQLPIYRLPIQLCSLTSVIFLLFLNSDKFKKLHSAFMIYALFGAILALLLSTSPPYPFRLTFWHYYIGHMSILVSYIYYMHVHDSKPEYKNMIKAEIFIVLFALLVALPINLMIGSDYLFIGPAGMESIPLLNIFGEWPTMLLIYMPLMIMVLAIPIVILYFKEKKQH